MTLIMICNKCRHGYFPTYNDVKVTITNHMSQYPTHTEYTAKYTSSPDFEMEDLKTGERRKIQETHTKVIKVIDDMNNLIGNARRQNTQLIALDRTINELYRISKARVLEKDDED